MGLGRFLSASVVVLGILPGCTPKSVVVPVSKTYVDCCDPGLDAATKDMCKWAVEVSGHTAVDQMGNRYEMVWSDCKEGMEPWRKYE